MSSKKTGHSDKIQIFQIDKTGNIAPIYEDRNRKTPDASAVSNANEVPAPLVEGQVWIEEISELTKRGVVSEQTRTGLKNFALQLEELTKRNATLVEELKFLKSKETVIKDRPEETGWLLGRKAPREAPTKLSRKDRDIQHKYELLKKDTQTLLDARDRQLLEFKERFEAMEAERETLEEKLRSRNRIVDGIEARKNRLIETMRLAISLLEAMDHDDEGANTKG